MTRPIAPAVLVVTLLGLSACERPTAPGSPDPLPTLNPSLAAGVTITELGTLGGTFSDAVAINDRGQVVGVSHTASGDLHAFFWDRGTMTDLGTLGGTFGRAVAVNARGQVAGSSLTADGPFHAFFWEAGTMTDLGTLGGASSFANAINERGQVVGSSTTAGGEDHATLWTVR